MISGASMVGNNEMHTQYLSGKVPVEIAENLKELFPEHGDLSVEAVIAEQESAYHYIQTNGKKKSTRSTSDRTSNRSQPSSRGESSFGGNVESLLSLDEAIARSLELGDDFQGLSVTEHSRSAAESRGSASREPAARVVSRNVREDDIDPDSMTYEELQLLAEAVGHESKGLPEELIRRLPSFKYKTGFFTKKRKKEECVICCAEYKSGNRLITLPCTHQYHSECIKRWLKLNKTCPVCQVEVRDD